MKITYTGKPEALTPAENGKIEAKFAKLAKLLDVPAASARPTSSWPSSAT